MLTNVHKGLKLPIADVAHAYICDGDYDFYHYVCDGFDDRGWGCGYRTLQTLCSWLHRSRQLCVRDSPASAPSIRDIQAKLVAVGDKGSGFVGSRDWIGCVEAAIVIDSLYDVPCKIIHVAAGSRLQSDAWDLLLEHFGNEGSRTPVMMGGNIDASSKGILGVCGEGDSTFVLVLDPHFVDVTHEGQVPTASIAALQKDGWVSWQPLNSFIRDSFYNLCLPQVKRVKPASK